MTKDNPMLLTPKILFAPTTNSPAVTLVVMDCSAVALARHGPLGAEVALVVMGLPKKAAPAPHRHISTSTTCLLLLVDW